MSILLKWIWKNCVSPDVSGPQFNPDDPLPWFKYFTAVKETDVRKRWRWKHLLQQSTWKRDHVTDTSEVRSHVDLRDMGEKVRTQKCSWRVGHRWFISGSVAYLRLNLC